MGKCHFQDCWITDKIFKSWIKRHPKLMTIAICKVCNNTEINIGKVGVSALLSHEGGKKHEGKENDSPLSALFFTKTCLQQCCLHQIQKLHHCLQHQIKQFFLHLPHHLQQSDRHIKGPNHLLFKNQFLLQFLMPKSVGRQRLLHPTPRIKQLVQHNVSK